ncbi:MAG TPA: multicopper oxidase domain-containing protein [Gemmatimonadales bacterium]|jgi:o-aminophenol oxidase|nr:multicopper oxidase domain-containing protein [Gemmatimonadales bacterium]
MTPPLQPPLMPFVDALPLPRRILASKHGGELTVRIRAAVHRLHRDLPESRVWAYDGQVPGPTIEAERGRPVRVYWRNEIEQPYPVVSTLAPTGTDGDGVPVQCLPCLSGGTPGPERRRVERLHRRSSARCPDSRSLRRLDGEPPSS